jgi:hypothetical protein
VTLTAVIFSTSACTGSDFIPARTDAPSNGESRGGNSTLNPLPCNSREACYLTMRSEGHVILAI